MRYEERAVPRDLQPFVAMLWSLEHRGAAAPASFERILPDGVAEAVFHFGRPFVQRFRDAEQSTQANSFVVLQASRLLEIAPSDPSDVGFVAVRFRPGGFAGYVDMPLVHLADRDVPATELWGRDVIAIEDGLARAADADARFDLVIAFLLARLAEGRCEPTDAIVRRVIASHGRIGVRQLAAELGCSERKLQRVFVAQIGSSPKQFARIVRFHAACRLIRGSSAPLAEIAVECGYFDQAHLVHDVREFAGETPSQLRARTQVTYP